MRVAITAFMLAAGAAVAQTADTEWLASKEAADFRARVVQLALLYGEGSGIDLRDFKVEAREKSKGTDGCGDVEVVTSKGLRVVRRETVRACQHPRRPPAPG